MNIGSAPYWRRIVVANVIAATVVLFLFSGASWRTPAKGLARGYAIAFLFSFCIGPLLGVVMPRIAPWIWRRVPFPFNWAAIALAMVGLAVCGSITAIGLLLAAGTVPAANFRSWVESSLSIAIAITLTVGLFMTAWEMMGARLAQATAEAQLASLESRVQPHFLFNTLNSIAALIHEDPKGAERMTGQLASILRTSLDQQATPLVPVQDELKTVRDYLAIEQVRFGDRLRVDIQVDPRVNGARVPRLALQTVVENSVKYAVSPRREGASIRISAGEAVGGIHATRVSVEDDGPGFDASALPAGHGLALLRDRVALLFGGRAALEIDGAPGRARVTLTVPDR
ncbi:MAG TPA: histidine kinase [Vicinamibacterales bacterium]|nr:histidine kinase [Vicinamibacterales bacterium]